MKTKLIYFCMISVLLFPACGSRINIEEKQQAENTIQENIIIENALKDTMQEGIAAQEAGLENTGKEDGNFLLWNPDQTEERQIIHENDWNNDNLFESIRISNNRRIYSTMVNFTEIFYDVQNSDTIDVKELFSIERAECDVLDYTINTEGNAYFLVLESGEDSEEIRVWKYDLDGIKTDIRQLNEFHKGEEDECYNWQIRAQADGTILVYSRLGYILFDEKGNTIQEETLKTDKYYKYDIWYVQRDIAVIKKYDEVEYASFWRRDLATGKEEKIQNIPSDVPSGDSFGFMKDECGNYLCYNSVNLYCYRPEKQEIQILFRWSDYGISGEEVEGIYLNGRELHCILLQEGTLSDVSFKNTVGNNQKTKIVLGCIGETSYLQSAVIGFNKTHQDYVILMEDYWQEDEAAAAQAVYRKVLAGDGPDIIVFSSGYISDIVLGEAGMLEDLNVYLKESKVIGREDIIAPLYDALQVNNNLYMLPVHFSLDTLITKKKWLNEDGALESRRILTILQEDSDLEISVSQSELLKRYALYGIAGQKEYETDRETIRNYLQFSRLFPEESIYQTDDFVRRNGRVLLEQESVHNVVDYLYSSSVWGEDSAMVGYPEIQGNGMAFCPVDCFAICTTSKQKEKAWKFIESLFAEQLQEDTASIWMDFSVCKSTLEKQLTAAMKRDYYVNEKGEKEEFPIQTYYMGEEPEYIYAAREEDIEKINDMIQGIRVVRRQNDPVVNILLEEASVYFSGDKDLEEVTDIIENRINLLQKEENPGD